MSEIRHILTRDASEHYLFVVEYMRKVGVMWSPVLAAMYFISFVCMAFTVVFTIYFKDSFQVGDLTQIFTYVLGQAILYVVFPTISLAHANSFIDTLVNIFKAAADDDFRMIGT